MTAAEKKALDSLKAELKTAKDELKTATGEAEAATGRVAELELAAEAATTEAAAAIEAKTSAISKLEQKLKETAEELKTVAKSKTGPSGLVASQPSGEFVQLDYYGDGPYSGTDPENGQPVNAQPGGSVIVSAKKAAQLLADFPCDFAAEGDDLEDGDSGFPADKTDDDDEG